MVKLWKKNKNKKYNKRVKNRKNILYHHRKWENKTKFSQEKKKEYPNF